MKEREQVIDISLLYVVTAEPPDIASAPAGPTRAVGRGVMVASKSAHFCNLNFKRLTARDQHERDLPIYRH